MQTGPATQNNNNDISRRGQEGVGKMRKWGTESTGVHSVLRSRIGALIRCPVMAAANKSCWVVWPSVAANMLIISSTATFYVQRRSGFRAETTG